MKDNEKIMNYRDRGVGWGISVKCGREGRKSQYNRKSQIQ